jgi:hypothetical protein
MAEERKPPRRGSAGGSGARKPAAKPRAGAKPAAKAGAKATSARKPAAKKAAAKPAAAKKPTAKAAAAKKPAAAKRAAAKKPAAKAAGAKKPAARARSASGRAAPKPTPEQLAPKQPESEKPQAEAPRSSNGQPEQDLPTAPSLGPNTVIEREPVEERLGRHEQSEVDAMGKDKRRQVVGQTYGPTFARQATLYGLVIMVLAAIGVGGKLLADKLDEPPATNPDKAPWSAPDARQHPPKPLQ